MVPFEFATAGRVVFGEGVSRQAASAISTWLSAEEPRRILMVVGQKLQRVANILEDLALCQIEAVLFQIRGEPTVAMAAEGVRLAREKGVQAVLSAGGGSVLDAGKAIAALAPNPGEPLDYLEVIGQGRTLQVVPLPFVAVPTTAGTGSEVTRNAVLSSPEHQFKASLRHPWMLPRLALVDPALTWDLPPALTASTGMDALTQLIEPFTSSRAQPLTDALCREGLRRGATALRRAWHDGSDRAARAEMCLVSLLGGMALANAGLGAAHGIAAPLGGMLPAPHGAICAALIPAVVEVNLRAIRQRSPAHPVLARYDELARLLTGRENADADHASRWLSDLAAELEIPKLRTWGLTTDQLPVLVDKAAASSSMKANPVALNREEIREIIERAM